MNKFRIKCALFKDLTCNGPSLLGRGQFSLISIGKLSSSLELHFLKGQAQKPSSIGRGVDIKLNGPKCDNSNCSCSIWIPLFSFYQYLQFGLGILRSLVCLCLCLCLFTKPFCLEEISSGKAKRRSYVWKLTYLKIQLLLQIKKCILLTYLYPLRQWKNSKTINKMEP